MMTFSLDHALNAALKELDLRGFSLATIPEGSQLRKKGEVMVINGDKVLAYAADIDEAVALARDFIRAKNKLKGK